MVLLTFASMYSDNVIFASCLQVAISLNCLETSNMYGSGFHPEVVGLDLASSVEYIGVPNPVL